MAFTKKQQIRGVRILLTVFYGFLLSSILFRYIINGIVETIRQPTNPYAITRIVLGTIILISIGLSIYATWFDNTIIMLVSGVVLIVVFILTLVFGVIRMVNTPSQRVITVTSRPKVVLTDDDSLDVDQPTSNIYGVAEDVTKLIIELIFILFAILGTFVLYRYVKSKYAPVSTTEPTATLLYQRLDEKQNIREAEICLNQIKEQLIAQEKRNKRGTCLCFTVYLYVYINKQRL